MCSRSTTQKCEDKRSESKGQVLAYVDSIDTPGTAVYFYVLGHTTINLARYFIWTSNSDHKLKSLQYKMPLRGIPNQISPELLKTLAEMGHGDEISKIYVSF